jgi:CP family cyanate transporter-like MFS transporter
LASAVLVSIQLTANVLNVPTILDEISQALGLQSASQGVLLSMPVLATAVGAIPGGILSEKVGMRKATAVGVGLLGGAGLSRGFSQTFPILLVLTFLVGFGYGLSLPNMARVVSRCFPGKLAGTASGIYTAGLSVGAILGLTLGPTLAALTGGWRGVLVVWGLLALATSLVWLLMVEEPGEPGRQTDGGKTSGLFTIRRVIRSPGVLALAGLFFMGNFLFYIETGWLKEFFDWRWGNPATSVVLISLLSVPFLPSNIGIPALSDKIGLRKIFLVVLGLVSAVAGYCFVFPSQSLAFLLTPLLGITVSAEFSLCLTLPVELVQSGDVGTASGFSASVGYLGGVAGPFMVGVLRQNTGGFDFLPQILAGVSVIFVLLSLVIPETGWKAKKPRTPEKGQGQG